MITRSVSALPIGTSLNRLLELQLKSHGHVRSALALAHGDDYRNVPEVRPCSIITTLRRLRRGSDAVASQNSRFQESPPLNQERCRLITSRRDLD